MACDAEHCSFVLLAEFDIDRGAQLTYQFPQPLGTDELLLANLMLPDGAEKQLEDWTIFFLNQTHFNTIAPVLALETPQANGQGLGGEDDSASKLLYVLNLVRTKHDKTVRRGAVVKAMAICTRHPFIQIFKPVLLMALDDYFSDPSQDCLARLFDAVNAMDLSAAPILTRHEKIVMRASERKDIFAEKFAHVRGQEPHPSVMTANPAQAKKAHRPAGSGGSYSSFEEGILMRKRGDAGLSQREPKNRDPVQIQGKGRDRSATESSSATQQHSPPSESSFPNAVWIDHSENGTESTTGSTTIGGSTSSLTGSSTLATSRGRRSTDASDSSSREHPRTLGSTPYGTALAKDTHFYHTSIAYKGHQLPIKMPLSTFPEEVGDYSLIQLIQTFSTPTVTVTGPHHPHLHTNGSLTHPVIILFNGLVTGKRIIFLGYNRPAGQVASYVLSACALGSGCGVVLRGFIERAFPYANLTNRDEWESIPAYIAGVTNPIFESGGSWDLLFDVGSGRVIVSKDIHTTFPPVSTPAPPILSRTGTIKAEPQTNGEDELGRLPGNSPALRSENVAKADSADNLFMEDINSAISCHFGESLVRMRFTDYVTRFVRLASRWEEEVIGSTRLGYPSSPFIPEGPNGPAQLGSGVVFSDESSATRELAVNGSRIEAWRRTNTYQYCLMDFQKSLDNNAIKGFDLLHQLSRLRQTKHMSDAEAEVLIGKIAENAQTYQQVVELLSYLTPHSGGLLHLSFGLFHQQESIREKTVDLFNELRVYPVGVLLLQSLNHFQRYAYVRQAHAREARLAKEQLQLQLPPPTFMSRTPSYRSESSLGLGG